MSVYFLIQTEAGRVREAAGSLRAVVGEHALDLVGGAFDIIVRADDAAAEAEILRRCSTRPFIRALPCRVREARRPVNEG